ncbi:hypothetical protein ACFZNO_24570 [Pseudomonas aeruginosa]
MFENTKKRLNPKYGATRRGVLILWVFSSSLFLYYFALASDISQDSLYFGYLNFVALLFGSGISYHVLIELLKIEQHKENEAKWRTLLKYLLIIQAGYIFAGLAIYLGFLLGEIAGFFIGNDWNGVRFILGLALLSSFNEKDRVIVWCKAVRQGKVLTPASADISYLSKMCRN